MSKKIICKIDSTGSKEFDSLRDKMHCFITDTINAFKKRQDEAACESLKHYSVNALRFVEIEFTPIDVKDGKISGSFKTSLKRYPPLSKEDAQAIYDHIHAMVK